MSSLRPSWTTPLTSQTVTFSRRSPIAQSRSRQAVAAAPFEPIPLFPNAALQFAPLLATLAVIGITLNVLGPRILGWATDVIFTGVIGKTLPAGMTKEQVVARLRAEGNPTFAGVLTDDWTRYLAPEFNDILPGNAHQSDDQSDRKDDDPGQCGQNG